MAGWMNILKAEVAKSNMSVVGRELNYSRTTISLVMSGGYRGSTNAIATAVIEKFGEGIHCPHLDGTLTDTQCAAFHTKPMPQSSASDLRHWRACQSCQHAKPALEAAQ